MGAAKEMKQSQEKVVLNAGDKSVELPILEGSEGEKAIDISQLRVKTGYITYDNGYGNTGSCFSKVTFLDGEKGVLKYRGYGIEDLASNASFEEVAYLLIHGELPTTAQLDLFNDSLARGSETKPEIIKLIESFPKEAHPMGVLASALTAMTAYYPENLTADPSEDEKNRLIAHTFSQVKNIGAHFYRVSKGQSVIPSDMGKFDYCEDFLQMCFGYKQGKIDPEILKAVNLLFILHADHEQNCSTSTVRLVGSSKANLYSAIAAGVMALWGPLHGGANQAVLEMLQEIQDAGGDYERFIQKAKDKDDPFRLMGFGHRVYKNFDPRAKLIKKTCEQVLQKIGVSDPLLAIAKGLEEAALSDEYFVSRKLYPNVDFYSGIIYRALGIPTDMFTVMFAIGRAPGWLGQWKEMREGSAFG